jgi:hypothetical protein
MGKGSKPLNDESGTAKRARLAPEIRSKIAHELRAFYSGIVNEGVPERFTELLRTLDESEGAEKK